MSTERSLNFVLTAATIFGCLANGAAGQGDPGNIAVDFANPVIGTVVLDSPGTQAYQLYAPNPGG